MTMSSTFHEIPIIDVSSLVGDPTNDKGRRKTASDIRKACTDIGFFYAANHSVSDEHLDQLLTETKRYFDLPTEEKMKIHIGKSKIFRGYIPLGKELTNEKEDWHEAVDFGLDLPSGHPDVVAGKPLQGPNQWPDQLPKFKDALEKHWDAMLNLASKITEGLALSLNLEENYFERFTGKQQCSMRITHYPPHSQNLSAEDVRDGIGAHIDYGFLTLLLQDDVGGLEVKNAAGKWIRALYVPRTFIVNIGHMTQRWTNDLYRATLHRVISPAKKSRHSIPFFFEPNFDTVVAPLEHCCSADNPPRYEPFHFGNYLVESFSRSYASEYEPV